MCDLQFADLPAFRSRAVSFSSVGDQWNGSLGHCGASKTSAIVFSMHIWLLARPFQIELAAAASSEQSAGTSDLQNMGRKLAHLLEEQITDRDVLACCSCCEGC